MDIPKIFEGWDYWNGRIYKTKEGAKLFVGKYDEKSVLTKTEEITINEETKQEIVEWVKTLSVIPEKCFICGETPSVNLGRQDIGMCWKIALCDDCLKRLISVSIIKPCPPKRTSGLNAFPLKRHKTNRHLFLSEEVPA